MKPTLNFLASFFLASLTALHATEIAVSSLDLTQATIHRELVRDKWKTFPNKSAAYFDKEKIKITEQGLPITLGGVVYTPGPTTCGGCVGSWQHEHQDAERFSEWGFDYLKCDWCSYDQVVKGDHSNKAYALKPYAVMDECLRQQKRDLVYSLCQYGMANVWEWAHEVHGNTWRTTADIGDSWGSVASIGFNQGGHEPYVKPGCWNDPDMMTLGFLGYRWSAIEDDEQYTEMSLWCLLAAPLLLGNDLTKMDEFTHNLLCNDEVIAVDQDPLGRMAACVASEGDTRVYAKAMSDGSLAVGLFNVGDATLPVSATWSQLKLTGPQQVRDLWRQQDLGVKANGFTTDVPRHGCTLLRIFSKPES